MGDPSEKFSLPAKFVTVFAISMLLGFGLCTVGALISFDSPSKLASFGAGCFWVSLVGLVVSLIWLAVDKGRRRNE